MLVCYSFANCFDVAYSLRYELNLILKKLKSIMMLKDSACLFNFIIQYTRTSRKIFVIDHARMKKVFDNNDIDYVFWISKNSNIANISAKQAFSQVWKLLLDTTPPAHTFIHLVIQESINVTKDEDDLTSSNYLPENSQNTCPNDLTRNKS